MIKRILVALDPGTDTQVATRYGIDFAREHDAELTGLAVVDLKSIGQQAQGGGIGSMYYAEQVEERLTETARAKAAGLVAAFSAAAQAAGVRADNQVLEGTPVEEITSVMNYYDLLLVGKSPHFFYSHPQELTNTLVEVIRRSLGPVLVVGDTYRPVARVLIAYDGTLHAGRALRSYVQLRPFGRALPTDLLHVYKDEEDRLHSEHLLRQAQTYLKAHGIAAHTLSTQGDHPAQQILDHVQYRQADLLVVGARSVSRIEQMISGSVTKTLLEDAPVPLFMDH